MKEANMSEKDTKPAGNPKADLEMMYIDEYLQGQGYSRNDLPTLPEQETKRLMIEASQYAYFKLEELESRARLLTDIHDVTDFS
jgi:hypothetical protein